MRSYIYKQRVPGGSVFNAEMWKQNEFIKFDRRLAAHETIGRGRAKEHYLRRQSREEFIGKDNRSMSVRMGGCVGANTPTEAHTHKRTQDKSTHDWAHSW